MINLTKNMNGTTTTTVTFEEILKRQQERELERQRREEEARKEEARKEEAAKKADLLDLINSMGVDTILAMLAKAQQVQGQEQVPEQTKEGFDVTALAESAKKSISKYYYKVYDKKAKKGANRVYEPALKKKVEALASSINGIRGVDYGLNVPNGYVTGNFACYILEKCNGDTTLLKHILEVLVQGNWANSYWGINGRKIRILYHTFVLHYEKIDEIKNFAVKILQQHDFRSMEVLANGDERYRYRLDINDKMIMWFESAVCEKIGDVPKYEGAAA